MPNEPCSQCGHKHNGNGVKKELEHQEELGKVAHDTIRSDINKIEEQCNRIDEKVTANFRFTLTTIISILAVLVIFFVGMNNIAMESIEELEIIVDEGHKLLYSDNALLDRLLSSDIVLNKGE